MEKASNALPRRLLIGSIIFGLFVLCDIALFGWLIFRSLSQREIERVLLETREEAEMLAKQIASRADKQGRDLYTAVAVERETQTYIDSILREREIVRTVFIRDNEGKLVFEMRSRTSPPLKPGMEATPISPELGQRVGPIDMPPDDVERVEREFAQVIEVPDIEVPIGAYGKLQIGISPVELSKRIGVLREELVHQLQVIAV